LEEKGKQRQGSGTLSFGFGRLSLYGDFAIAFHGATSLSLFSFLLQRIFKVMIYFMRHAHRPVSDPSFDNGISEKGWQQCARLEGYFRKRKIKIDEVRSSPKMRCMQTTEFVSELWNLPVQEDWALVESNNESDKDFRNRVIVLAEKLRGESRNLLLGTHGDLLAVLLRWGDQAANIEIRKGDLLIWDPSENSWDANPVRREEGSLKES